MAGPTPGSSSSSFSEAVFKSTGADGAADAELFEDFDDEAEVDSAAAGFSALEDFSDVADFSEVEAFSELFSLLALLFETVTSEEILSTVLDGRPAFDRSATEE